jgi:hypothetical protein
LSRSAFLSCSKIANHSLPEAVWSQRTSKYVFQSWCVMDWIGSL